MKYLKTYEENKPDLRKVGDIVKCIKDYQKNYHKDNFYEVGGFYGDPQRAIEEFGINDYLPVECIGRVVVIGDNKKITEFSVNKKYAKTQDKPDFFEFFEITGMETKKYNL